MAVNAIFGSLRELAGRFASDAFGFGVGQAISTALQPESTSIAQEAWSVLPVRALDPADLAAMAVQGVMPEDEAAAEAVQSGYNADRFHKLFLVNGSPIAPDQALDLWNRGEISEADVDRALLQSRLKPEWVDTFKLLKRQLLQAAELAEMVVQGILTEPEGTTRAQFLGYHADDFARMVRLAGNPPGPETLLQMWNRGITDEAGVDLGLVQSRLKPEWVDRFKKLRTNPPTLGAIVSAAIKERITIEHAIELARAVGTDEPTLRMLVDEGGRPISITEGLQLLRRKKIDETRFREVVARSDVKTEFTANLLGLLENLPSLAQMRAIIATGAIDDTLAKTTLQHMGYSDAIIAGIVAAGHGVKLEGSKQLAQTAITQAYQDQQIDVAEATKLLEGLGYDAADAGMLIGLADFNRVKAYRTAVIGVVKARYLQGDVDENTASGMLDQIKMPAAERDQYLALWTFDRQSNPRLLTLADLNAAYKAKLYSQQQYRDYLPRLGYQEPEISVLVSLHAPV